MEFRVHAAWLTALIATALVPTGASDKPHSRQKRILWVTNDGRLALPPGTALVITPSLSMPFVRYPPDGFLSNMSISLPFTSTWPLLGDLNAGTGQNILHALTEANGYLATNTNIIHSTQEFPHDPIVVYWSGTESLIPFYLESAPVHSANCV
jgi:hypothetical protein